MIVHILFKVICPMQLFSEYVKVKNKVVISYSCVEYKYVEYEGKFKSMPKSQNRPKFCFSILYLNAGDSHGQKHCVFELSAVHPFFHPSHYCKIYIKNALMEFATNVHLSFKMYKFESCGQSSLVTVTLQHLFIVIETRSRIRIKN